MNPANSETISLDGTHLMLDCFGCDKKALSDKKLISKFLDCLPATLGMKKLVKPHIVSYHGGETWDRGGITGFVLIAESHISIHTFQHDGFFTADVYSCKPFDLEKAFGEFKNAFRFKTHKIRIVKRDIELIRRPLDDAVIQDSQRAGIKMKMRKSGNISGNFA